jgi:hypothetical protein
MKWRLPMILSSLPQILLSSVKVHIRLDFGLRASDFGFPAHPPYATILGSAPTQTRGKQRLSYFGIY